MSKTKKKKSNNPLAKNPRYLRRRRISPLKLAFWLILALLAGFVAYNMYRFFFDKSYINFFLHNIPAFCAILYLFFLYIAIKKHHMVLNCWIHSWSYWKTYYIPSYNKYYPDCCNKQEIWCYHF